MDHEAQDLPLEGGDELTAPNATPAPFTEDQARAWRTEHPDASIRQAAAAWGWHRSRAARLLSRLSRETPGETAPLSRETGETAADQWDGFGHSSEHFAFWKPENGDIMTPGSPALAVYLNHWNQIVLRAETDAPPGAMGGNSDIIILINPSDVPRLIDRLRALAEEASEGCA